MQWLFWIIAILLSSGAGYWVFIADKRRSVPYPWLTALLRGIVVLLALLLLLAPAFTINRNYTEKPVVLFLQDDSRSIPTALKNDSAAYRHDAEALLDKLSDKYHVIRWAFGNTIKNDSLFGYRQDATDISAALNRAQDFLGSQNLGAVILATDGRYNQGMNPQFQELPLHSSLYTVAIGDSAAAKDIRITQVYANRTVSLNSQFEIRADLVAELCKGYNAQGKIIYIGKAINLRKRVKSHFSNNKTGRQKQDFLREIYRISYKPCATDLMAHILESVEIRKLWPVHNRSQKGYLPKFGLLVYEDRQGYKRLAIEHNKTHAKPVYTFNTLTEGHQRLRELIREFGLCARLCHLAPKADCTNGQMADTCTGTCAALSLPGIYNGQVEQAVAWLQRQLPTFVLLDKGLNEEEQSCILIRKGNIYGMGYIREENLLQNLDKLQEQLEPFQDNDYIRNLVYRHAAEHPEKCVHW